MLACHATKKPQNQIVKTITGNDAMQCDERKNKLLECLKNPSLDPERRMPTLWLYIEFPPFQKMTRKLKVRTCVPD